MLDNGAYTYRECEWISSKVNSIRDVSLSRMFEATSLFVKNDEVKNRWRINLENDRLISCIFDVNFMLERNSFLVRIGDG